ncbi:MAG: competence protein CoiA family protein [Sedimenticola sp.]
MKQPEPRLLYGLRDSVLMHISEVERGLACQCTCPGCGAELIARKGDVQQHHFAHASGADCATGIETGLHLASKDILAKRKEILLPVVEVRFPGGKPPIEVIPEGFHKVSNVRLETGVGGLIPDVLVDIDGRSIAIEIFVTHRVDEEKTQRFRQLGLSAIEIDLSKVARDLEPEQLDSIVIEGKEQKRWLFHTDVAPREKEAWEQANRLSIVERGLAKHVDGCPIPAREYKGKPYANVIDDCIGCPHSLEIGNVVVCDANLGLRPEVLDWRILLWSGTPSSVDFFINGELVRRVDVDTVLRSQDGTLLFEGYNYKQKKRQTYSAHEVREIIDIETGDIREIKEWLRELTRGSVIG